MRDKTLKLIEAAYGVLQEYNPMTLRQCYYQLVSKHVIDNNANQYKRLSYTLVKARQEGLIPWDWIEDRIRQPRVVSMWNGLQDFMDTVREAYRKDIWNTQPNYIEVWLEKDALSGIFEDITNTYGVTLVVGRGYNSWSAYKEAVERIARHEKPAKILYFGDFDPSGEDIVRALANGLNFDAFGQQGTTHVHEVAVEKIALTKEHVLDYDLPPDFTKKTDTRSRAFVEKYGDMAVELDALPMQTLQEELREAIEANLDLSAFSKVLCQQEAERTLLRKESFDNYENVL